MILSRELVITSLLDNSKENVIRTLSGILYEQKRISDLEEFIKHVMDREKEFSTGFGRGVAIPHGKTNVVKEPSIMVAKLKKGIEWNSLDNEPVQLVFLLAVPEEANGKTHLKIMSKLAENLIDPAILEKLTGIDDPDNLYEYLEELLGGQEI